jgi:3-oxoacyl-[acyl-carrier protein] reductase
MVASAAIPRQAGPEDVCGALDFFVSDAAAWITGQTLVVDGGIIARL